MSGLHVKVAIKRPWAWLPLGPGRGLFLGNVRFTPESGHCETLLGCPLCAKSGSRPLSIDYLVGSSE